jgi:hypothetical protein
LLSKVFLLLVVRTCSRIAEGTSIELPLATNKGVKRSEDNADVLKCVNLKKAVFKQPDKTDTKDENRRNIAGEWSTPRIQMPSFVEEAKHLKVSCKSQTLGLLVLEGLLDKKIGGRRE